MTKFPCAYCGGYEAELMKPDAAATPGVLDIATLTYVALQLDYTRIHAGLIDEPIQVCPRCVIRGLELLFGPRVKPNAKT